MIDYLSPAGLEVLAERWRHINEEGWTPEHDDKYHNNELLWAAVRYAVADIRAPKELARWPWARSWWKPSSRRRNLIKAASLLVAEVERLDRESARGAAGEKK